jgi:hypothetical protein
MMPIHNFVVDQAKAERSLNEIKVMVDSSQQEPQDYGNLSHFEKNQRGRRRRQSEK